MVSELLFPRYQDPWFDHGLETLFDVVAQAGDEAPLRGRLTPDGVILQVTSLDEAARWLDGLIEDRSNQYLVYDHVRTRDQQVTERLHPYLVFHTQPARQWPELYLGRTPRGQEVRAGDRRVALIRSALAVGLVPHATDRVAGEGGEPSGRRRGPGSRGSMARCPFCGSTARAPLADLTQAVYPLATKNAALSGSWQVPGTGRRLLTQAYQKACPRCHLIGSLVWVDGAFLFRTFVGSDARAEWTTLIFPDPVGMDLDVLHRLKSRIRQRTRRRRALTNLYLAAAATEGTDPLERPAPGATYGLLLSYVETALATGASYGGDWLEPTVEVPDQWIELIVPGGRMKNIKLSRHVLDRAFPRRATAWLQAGVRPGRWIVEVDLASDGRRPVPPDRREKALRARQETLARSLVRDDLHAFAEVFVPRGGLVVRPRGPWTRFSADLYQLIQIWRSEHAVSGEQLELLRRAGQSLGRVAQKRISLVYRLERARRAQDVLAVLAEVGHFLAGAQAEEMEYISLSALDQLTWLVATEALPLHEIRDTLVVFASLEVARHRLATQRTRPRSESVARTAEVTVDAS